MSTALELGEGLTAADVLADLALVLRLVGWTVVVVVLAWAVY